MSEQRGSKYNAQVPFLYSRIYFNIIFTTSFLSYNSEIKEKFITQREEISIWKSVTSFNNKTSKGNVTKSMHCIDIVTLPLLILWEKYICKERNLLISLVKGGIWWSFNARFICFQSKQFVDMFISNFHKGWLIYPHDASYTINTFLARTRILSGSEMSLSGSKNSWKHLKNLILTLLWFCTDSNFLKLRPFCLNFLKSGNFLKSDISAG